MDRVKDLIDYLREEPEEQAWATAGSKKDKSHDNRASTFRDSIRPQTLLDKFYSEGKILPGHLDERLILWLASLCPDLHTLVMEANHWLLFILAGTHGLHMQTLSLPAAAEHLLPHGSLL